MTKQTNFASKFYFIAGKFAISFVAGSIALLASSNSAAQAKDIFRMNSQGSWDKVPGCGQDVGIGFNGAVWVIGCDNTQGGNGIYNWQGDSTWRKIYGGAKRIAVNPNGTPVVVNDSGQLFEGDGNGGWKAFPGCARDVGIGANGALWVVGCNAVTGGYGIYQWIGSGWRSIVGGAVAISVFPDGRLAMVNNADEIFIGDGQGKWQQLDGKAKDISVGANGSLWVIGNNVESNGYGIYKRTGTTWQKIPGSAVRIAVNPQGIPWVVNQDPATQALDNLLDIQGITDPNGYYAGQCVSFVKRFTNALGFWMNPTGGNGGAKEIFYNYNQPGLSLSAQQADRITFTGSEKPRVGDIIVFDATSSNPFGHVAVVQSVLDNGRIVIQESNANNKAPHTSVTRSVAFSPSSPLSGYGRVLGWLRLKM